MLQLCRLIFVLVVLRLSDAFTSPTTCRPPNNRVQQALHLTNKVEHHEFVQHLIKSFGLLSIGSIMALNIADASAISFNEEPSSVFVSSSSTMIVAEAVKTMDFSLPSSYDSIADAKSTGASLVQELEQPENKGMPAKKEQKTKDGSSSKGPSLASVLPSMNKSVKKEQPQPKQQNTASSPLSKSIDEIKEEKQMEKIKIVDMDLPSYSDTITKKEKSVFSL